MPPDLAILARSPELKHLTSKPIAVGVTTMRSSVGTNAAGHDAPLTRSASPRQIFKANATNASSDQCEFPIGQWTTSDAIDGWATGKCSSDSK
jgi:hypothetical protein